MSILDDKIARFSNDMDLVHQFTHGLANQTVTTEGGPIPTLARLIAQASAAAANSLFANSSTTLTLGVGAKVFRIETGKQFSAGQFIVASSSAGSMAGTVSSYVDDTLTVNVTKFTGTGAAASWKIALTAMPGVDGRDGVDGTNGTGGGTTGPTVSPRNYVASYPWEGGGVTPVPVDSITLDATSQSAYSTAIAAAATGTKRNAGATSIINGFGTAIRFILKKDGAAVMTADYTSALISFSDGTDIGVMLGNPVAVNAVAADISTGVWTAEILGGASYSRKMTMTAGPTGSGKHIILDGNTVVGMGYDATFAVVVPRSVDGL